MAVIFFSQRSQHILKQTTLDANYFEVKKLRHWSRFNFHFINHTITFNKPEIINYLKGFTNVSNF